MTTITVLLLGLAMAAGQAGPGQVAPGRSGPDENSQLSDTVFKNVKILKGIPVDEFMDTMGMFSAATNMNCVDCHADDNTSGWDKFATDTPLKEAARRMLLMVNSINKDNFKGV